MKKTTSTLLAVAVIAAMSFAIASCSKEKTNEAPTITLQEPEENATVALNDEIHVEGTASDDNELHEMAIWVTYMGDTLPNPEYPTVHAMKTYDFHSHYDATAAGTYTVNVVAADHEGLITSVTRTVTVTP